MILLAASGMAADLTGSWTCDVQTDAGSGTPRFVFEHKGDALTGKYSGQLGDAQVKGKVVGENVSWAFQVDLGSVLYEGKLAGGEIKGSVDLAGQASGKFSCRKD